MKKALVLLLVSVCHVGGLSQTVRNKRVTSSQPFQAKPASEQLPIKRVILYSNGVAYIERRGWVTGNAQIDLSFKQSQVDDVLKSMVVLDLGQGKIGAVSYNSSAPISSRMSEIPFSVNPVSGDGGGISSVLSQLQGAKVVVTSAKGTATGSILTVERKQVKTEKETLNTSVLVIASENGEISSFDLNDVRGVKLIDEGTQKDINDFANATASARRLDAKTISVTSQGTGQREMIVSYTIAAPIWKTTYRVVLDKEGKPFFQGWAIVDNVSDENWDNVQMSLVSGSPISFIQNLQKPFYRYRPVVPTPQDLQMAPQVHEDGVGYGSGSGRGDGGESGTAASTNAALGNTIIQRQISDLPTTSRNVLALSAAQNAVTVDGVSAEEFRLTTPTVGEAIISGDSGVTAAATGNEIGDLFEYRIEQPVTVEKNRSALIPIVQTKMEGERIAIYNEATRTDRPLSGVLLKNTTDLTLESGSLTVLDSNAYAGEALMERLKPKETRLISFALDLGTHVRVRNDGNREPFRLIKAVNGVLQVHYFRSEQKTYELTNQTDRPKVMYIEFPVRDGWQLAEDAPKPDYVTQRFYRFRVELGPFEEKKFNIAVRQPLMDNYQLASLSRTDLDVFVARGYINAETRAKLDKIIDIRGQIAGTETRLRAFNEEAQKISSDQRRFRENIEALSKTPEAKTLIARYIAKAGEQETRLEEMEKEKKNIESERTRLMQEQSSAIRGFEIR